MVSVRRGWIYGLFPAAGWQPSAAKRRKPWHSVAYSRTGKVKAVLEAGGVTIDTARAVVKKDGEEIFLSALEYRLLLILFNNKGVLLGRDRLLEEIWDVAGEFVNDNTLSVTIKRIREKIGDKEGRFLKTVRGMGYRLES